MIYNNRFKMQDLFQNKDLAGVFPQFGGKTPLRNLYSYADIERQVLKYLQGVFGGRVTSRGNLVVNGNKAQVLRRVGEMAGMIEIFFNNATSVVKNLRSNTRLYMPYSTLNQIGELNTPYKKQQAMKAALENLYYNPDFQSSGSAPSSSVSYKKRQDAWKRKVGYKE